LKACGCGGWSEGALVSGAKVLRLRRKNGGVRFISWDRNDAAISDCLNYLNTLS